MVARRRAAYPRLASSLMLVFLRFLACGSAAISLSYTGYPARSLSGYWTRGAFAAARRAEQTSKEEVVMYERILADYSAYLRERQLTQEGRVVYYVGWVRQFLEFAATDGGVDFEHCLLRFLDTLQARPEWQVGQAKNAVRIYQYQYRGGAVADVASAGPPAGVDPGDLPAVLTAMTELLRLKHYRYRTEQTYTAWVRRFYALLRETWEAA